MIVDLTIKYSDLEEQILNHPNVGRQENHIFKNCRSATNRRLKKSKSTMEILEQCVKSILINNKDNKKISMTPFWCLYC